MTCKTCGKEYTIDCDYRQGRCPLHPPIINSHSMRFYNLFKLIKKGTKELYERIMGRKISS